MVFIVTACSFARSFPAPTVSALLGKGGTAGSDDPNPPTPHGEHDEEEPTVLGGPDGAATMFPMEVVDVSRDSLGSRRASSASSGSTPASRTWLQLASSQSNSSPSSGTSPVHHSSTTSFARPERGRVRNLSQVGRCLRACPRLLSP